ncbi:MAG: porin family protein [Holosporaceae bacterium]|jgi:opacity protein-like surface antigen|nr:porin family protein [Holosporaceae bacterium]
MKKVVFAATAFLSCAAALASDEVSVTTVDEGAVPCECAFDSVYLGLGAGGSFLKSKAEHDKLSGSKSFSRFIGSVFLGAGKSFKKFYIGAEGLLDFTKSKSADIEKETGGVTVKGTLRNGGVSPQLGIRLGAIVKDSWLIFLKVAGVYNKTSLKIGDREGSCSKLTPALSLGVEKLFCKKFSARLEGEYVFSANKTAQYTIDNKDVDVKIKNEGGFVIRALAAYNVKY